MPFKPGQQKAGGRKKGVVNKRTLILQEVLENLQMNVPEKIAETLTQVENALTQCYSGEELIMGLRLKADIYLNLMQYIYPRLKSIETKDTTPQSNEPLQVNLNWADENDHQHKPSK